MDANKYIIRPINPVEIYLLSEFLYLAIHIPKGVKVPPRNIIEIPELKIYIDDFGSKYGDFCFVAETDGLIVGAAWTRIMNDYGHIDNNTPSLAISIYENFRNKGIGSMLINELSDKLKQEQFSQVSLSVQKTNPAVRLYKRLGFKTMKITQEEYIMVLELAY